MCWAGGVRWGIDAVSVMWGLNVVECEWYIRVGVCLLILEAVFIKKFVCSSHRRSHVCSDIENR